MTPPAERIVFIGGLHRSGTTPLARWLSGHPEVSGLTDTGVFEDEGQHLQSVYRPAREHGGPGRFALDPAARLTETSPLVTPGAARSLVEAWSPYWDTSRSVLLEKSPPNLIRMRFLRALFPVARFIVIVRHPVAVSVATSKWAGSDLDALMRNWVAAHRQLAADAAHVGRTALVRYEDLVSDPAAELDRIFAFLGLGPHEQAWPAQSGVNEKYYARFTAMRRPWRRTRHNRLISRFDPEVSPFGYSLAQPAHVTDPAPQIAALMAPRRDSRPSADTPRVPVQP